MNRILADALIFAGGLVVGAVTSGLIVKKKCDKKMEEELKSQSDYYEARIDELYDDEAVADSDISEEEAVEEAPEEYSTSPMPVPEQDSLTRGRYKKPETTDYTTYYKGKRDQAESESPKEDADYYEEARGSKDKGPKFIKMEEFGDDPRQSEVHLHYYMDDGVLTLSDDQSEELLEDFDEIHGMIGDALSKFGFDNNDEEVIYIRNRARGCDYEIVKIFGSYKEY